MIAPDGLGLGRMDRLLRCESAVCSHAFSTATEKPNEPLAPVTTQMGGTMLCSLYLRPTCPVRGGNLFLSDVRRSSFQSFHSAGSLCHNMAMTKRRTQFRPWTKERQRGLTYVGVGLPIVDPGMTAQIATC
jgi:hypothetical protein